MRQPPGSGVASAWTRLTYSLGTQTSQVAALPMRNVDENTSGWPSAEVPSFTAIGPGATKLSTGLVCIDTAHLPSQSRFNLLSDFSSHQIFSWADPAND